MTPRFPADSVLFDLDGTLWDAGEGTAEAYNETAASMGLSRRFTAEDLHGVMGLQAQEILDRFVPQLDRQAQQRFSQAVSAAECEILRTGRGSTLFPGVRSLLETLRGRGLRLFIVSNCQAGYIEAFLEAYGLAPLIEGFEHPGRTGLDKGGNIALVVRTYGLRAPVYVGDAAVDEAGARKAGVPFIRAAYGFGTPGSWDASIDAPQDLPALLAPPA